MKNKFDAEDVLLNTLDRAAKELTAAKTQAVAEDLRNDYRERLDAIRLDLMKLTDEIAASL